MDGKKNADIPRELGEGVELARPYVFDLSTFKSLADSSNSFFDHICVSFSTGLVN